MAETRMTTDIGTTSIRRNQEYKCCGVLLIEKKRKVLQWNYWCQKYFIITKGAKNCCWNLFCFMDQFATKAEWAYSMKEMESVREYCKEDKDIVGFRIVFEAAKTPDIILRCDTEENKAMWMSNMQEAISEAHQFSIDSGFGSGASVTSLQRCVSKQSQTDISDGYEIINDIPVEVNTRSSNPDTQTNAEGVNVEHHSNQQAFIRQQRQEDDDYEDVVKDPLVMLRDPSNKTLKQEMKDKRNAIIVTTGGFQDVMYKVVDETIEGTLEETKIYKTFEEIPTVHGNAGAMSLPLLPSIARSESFVSVKADSDTCSTVLSTSSLDVTCGTADTSIDTREYENVEYRMHKISSNERNSSSSSGSDTYEKPTHFSLDVNPDEYVCEEGQNPETLLRDTPDGTFLIQRKKKGMGLHVMTQAGVKCFKVFEKNGKVSIYKDFSISPDSVFSSLENFLKHYNVHCIPKEEFSVRLIQGYRKIIRESTETE